MSGLSASPEISGNSGKPIPFFNYPDFFQQNEDKFVELFREVGRRGAFILQQDLRDFEKDLADFVGCRYAIGLANATDALRLGLQAMGIGKGDEVIFCSHTFVATAGAIVEAGATPVPVEAGWDRLIDPDSILKAITPRTKAIMPTQLNGRTANMDKILAIVKEKGLRLCEDSAQGLGSRFNGQHAGTFGEFGVLSFYPAKVLGCFGDGGALITNNEELYQKVMLLRDHGRDPKTGEVTVWGCNSRLDNLQAALLSMQLKSYDRVMARRREIATLYQEGLGDLPELDLPPAPNSDAKHFDIYQNYEFLAKNRDQLKDFLKEKGIGTLIQWSGKAVHQFSGLGFKQSLPYTEELFTRLLMIPINLSITNDEVQSVIRSIREFYGK